MIRAVLDQNRGPRKELVFSLPQLRMDPDRRPCRRVCARGFVSARSVSQEGPEARTPQQPRAQPAPDFGFCIIPQ